MHDSLDDGTNNENNFRTSALYSLDSTHCSSVRGEQTKIDKDLIHQFLSHVLATPEKVAMVTSESSWTYQQLYVDVVRWRAFFSHQPSHQRVIVCLSRTPRLMSILLALQWLGITYIPVDPAMPRERLKVVVEDSEASAILFDAPNPLNTKALPCTRYFLSEIELPPFEAPKTEYSAKALQASTAYIIYTSGSTGKPKGVAISRVALNNFLMSMSRIFLTDENAYALAITTLAFDIAALELYLPLWQNKTVFLANQEEHQDPFLIKALLSQHPITLLQATPTMWKMLLNVDFSLNAKLVALSGGEPLTQTLANNLLPNVAALWNMYGPTEATIWCSLKQIKPGEAITVGRPIENMEMYVLNDALQEVGPNEKGGLYIAGLGLAMGYVNNEEQTSQKFIPHAQALGGRLYVVGDVACVTEKGEFILFGRTDNQVKLHGYRIELEDVEAHIQKNPAIAECAALVAAEQLVAYVSLKPKVTLSEDELKASLALQLPHYMLPSRILFLPKLPTTLNGKVDRKALPAPVGSQSVRATHSSPLYEALLTIWSEEFHHSAIGIDDNFFDLGGHSLIAVRIVSKIQKQFKKRVTLKDLYQELTIAKLALVIEKAHPLELENPQGNQQGLCLDGALPLNDFQLMLWMSMIFEPGLKNFNVVGRKRVMGPINKAALDAALQAVYQKQEVFAYTITRYYPKQKYQQFTYPSWSEITLQGRSQEEEERGLKASFDDLYYHSPLPVTGPLLIAKCFYLSQNQVELQVCISHLISDEASIEIFFSDLSEAYLQYEQKSLVEKPAPSMQIATYALLQQETFTKHGRMDAAFWKHYLADAGLCYFKEKDVVHDTTTKDFYFSTYTEIPERLLSQVRQFAVHHRVTLSDVLCAAIGLALQSCSENLKKPQGSLVMSVVKSTREHPQYDHLIGCFLRVHPIKLALKAGKSLLALAKEAHHSSVETLSHQRASSLVKLASIGLMPQKKVTLKAVMLLLLSFFYLKRKKKNKISETILNACKTLALAKRSEAYLINVNVLNNFLTSTNHPKERQFLGKPCAVIPHHPYNLSLVKYVVDICFLRESEGNTPYCVISSNLTPAFRQHLAQTLLQVMEEACQDSPQQMAANML